MSDVNNHPDDENDDDDEDYKQNVDTGLSRIIRPRANNNNNDVASPGSPDHRLLLSKSSSDSQLQLRASATSTGSAAAEAMRTSQSSTVARRASNHANGSVTGIRPSHVHMRVSTSDATTFPGWWNEGRHDDGSSSRSSLFKDRYEMGAYLCQLSGRRFGAKLYTCYAKEATPTIDNNNDNNNTLEQQPFTVKVVKKSRWSHPPKHPTMMEKAAILANPNNNVTDTINSPPVQLQLLHSLSPDDESNRHHIDQSPSQDDDFFIGRLSNVSGLSNPSTSRQYAPPLETLVQDHFGFGHLTTTITSAAAGTGQIATTITSAASSIASPITSLAAAVVKSSLKDETCTSPISPESASSLQPPLSSSLLPPQQQHHHDSTSVGASLMDNTHLPPQAHLSLHHAPYRNLFSEFALLRVLQQRGQGGDENGDDNKEEDFPWLFLQPHDLLENAKHYFIVTEYYDPTTQSLAAYLQQQEQQSSPKKSPTKSPNRSDSGNHRVCLGESQVSSIARQILTCLRICHQHHIVHCNLKLDSFIVVPSTDDDSALSSPRIKLIDLTSAVVLSDLTTSPTNASVTSVTTTGSRLRLMEPRGTIRYMAPEVVTLGTSYGAKCDVWSCGIILHVLLTGSFPLDGTSFRQVQELVLGTLPQPSPQPSPTSQQQQPTPQPNHWLIPRYRSEPHWQTVSNEAKHFLYRLLAPLEEDRPTAERALQHPWVQPRSDGTDGPLDGSSNNEGHDVQSLSSKDAVDNHIESIYSAGNSGTMGSPPLEAIYEDLYQDPTDGATSHACHSNASTVTSALGPKELFPQQQPSSLSAVEIEALNTFLEAHDTIYHEWLETNRLLMSEINLNMHHPMTRQDVRQAYLVLFELDLEDDAIDKVFAKFSASESDAIDGVDFFVAVLNEKDMLFTDSIHEAFEVFDDTEPQQQHQSIQHGGLVATASLGWALREYLVSEEAALSEHDKAFVIELVQQVEAEGHQDGNKGDIALEELVAIILESTIPKSDTAHQSPPAQPRLSAPVGAPQHDSLSTISAQSAPLDHVHADPTRLPSWDSSIHSGTSSKATYTRQHRSSWLDRLSLKFSAKHFIAQRPGRLHHYYELTDFVNEGGCGAVWFCTHKETGAERAVKLVRKSQVDVEYNKRILEEFLILRELDHPNILKQYELYEDTDFFYIVMDAARGGDLCLELDEFGAFIEEAAAALMQQLLSCINYLHSSDIVHCDLKPENIMLEANRELSSLKVIDFGFAANIKQAPNQRLTKRWGTMYYSAPEVFAGDYGKKADVWSAGVICYLLLSDEFPFFGDTWEEVMEIVQNESCSFSGPYWDAVSESAKDFVAKLLTIDETKRLSAEEALRHPWIQHVMRKSSTELKPDEIDAIRTALTNVMNFCAQRKLKQAVYSLIAAQFLDKEEKEATDSVFRRLDTECNGRLTRIEIRLAFRNFLCTDLSDQEVDDIFTRVDVDGSGFIEYSEFLMAAMNEEVLLEDVKLQSAFGYFDIDKSGQITPADLKFALSDYLSGNANIDDAVLAEIVDEVDLNEDGAITFEEFAATMASNLVYI